MRIKQYCVYILECISSKGKRSFYTGYTGSLETRIMQHSEGKGAKYTKGKKIKLLFYENFKNRGDAMRRELFIKKFSRKQKKDLIKSEKNLLLKDENKD